MATVTLNLQVVLESEEKASLLELTARLRTGQSDFQVPVNLGPYILGVINNDIVACRKEIKSRRGA